MMAPFPTKFRSHSGGFAIVLVLAAVVLLVGVALAFFSNAMLQKQISQSSASRVRTDIFAQGAIDTVVSDLKAEIKAGSSVTNIVSGGVTTLLYFPTAATNVVPSLAGSSGTNGLENLVKRSSGSSSFYPGGVNRSSSTSSTNESSGGRSISLSRWNKPLYLPTTSATDPAPPNSVGFVAPDWIYVSRDGSNPTSWNNSLKTSKTDPAAVVGRYALAIYDEGGLLDVNAAGFLSGLAPAATATLNKARKGSLAYADLALIFETAGFTSSRAAEIVDGLVNWRNEATLQGATNALAFDTWAVKNKKGFLSTANTALASNKSDRIFTSRQQLQKFLFEKTAVSGEEDKMQKALNYLATFTRDLNQPSLIPASSKGGPLITANQDNGGNDAYGGDSVINPGFLTVRVASEFDRNEKDPISGAIVRAKIGEPLVKKRFDLNRLAWLTYAGPITLNGSSYNSGVDSSYINTLKATYGFTDEFLLQGTPANIFKYFGLSWVPVSMNGVSVNAWVYSHSGSAPLSSAPIVTSGTSINTMAKVVAANREPDFVELLKASITAGSLAKGATDPTGIDNSYGTINAFESAQSARDTALDYAVLQIAANVIDQYDGDGYPSVIRFAPGSGVSLKEFRGVENLPYYYRNQIGVLEAALPLPAPSTTSDPNSPPLTNAGFCAAVIQPQIWNPHDVNSSMGTPGPQSFRLVVDSAPLDVEGNPVSGLRNSVTFGTLGISTANHSTSADTTKSPPFFNNYALDPVELTPTTTELDFEIPATSAGTALFREPTLLIKPNVPAGSNLRIGSGNYLATKFTSAPYSAYFPGSGIMAVNNNPSVPASDVNLGVYLGVAPLRWVASNNTIYTAYDSNLVFSSNVVDPAATFRMQYRDANNNWVTYDEKYVRVASRAPRIAVFKTGLPDRAVAMGHSQNGDLGLNGSSAPMSVGVDPRTSRFGAIHGQRTGGLNAWVGNGGNSPTWLDQSKSMVGSMWRDLGDAPSAATSVGTGGFVGVPMVAGWYPSGGTTFTGKPAPNWFSSGSYRLGFLSQNNPVANAGKPYYADADGVVRRAMGAYVNGITATVGAPMLKTLGAGAAANQSQSRPMILNRPFRSAAELGAVFSDIPWRNLDLSTPESGFAGLLDVFCVNATDDPTGMVAGKVNLNSRQTPVLQAVLAGAYHDEQSPTSTTSSRTLASATAQALTSRTTSVASDKGPLGNLSELVGRWVGSQSLASGGIDGSQSFSGFSKDLSSALTDQKDLNISRFREAPIRALSVAGQTRVWNLMIDLVAQTGRFPTNADKLEKFVVEGEQRYWVHLAIDRLTGQVIDKQVEVVKE